MHLACCKEKKSALNDVPVVQQETIAPGQSTLRPLAVSSLSSGFGLTTGGQETNGDLLKRVVATVDQSITFAFK